MAAPPPRGALPRTAAWRTPARLPACFPACLPGKSGGRRRLLFRVPARPHRRRRGEGCAQRRPPAPLGRLRGFCPTRPQAWDITPPRPRRGDACGGRSLPLSGIRNRARRAAGRVLRPPSRGTGRRLVPATEPAAPEGLRGGGRAVTRPSFHTTGNFELGSSREDGGN